MVLNSEVQGGGGWDGKVYWFDFCFTALQHILDHFGRGQLPYHTVPGQAS